MSYRKLWIALVLVLVISFAVLGGVGINVMNNAPPIPSQVVTTDGRTCCSTAPPSWTDRTPGSRSAARKSARSGDTAPTSPPTGRPTGCTASQYSSSTGGPGSWCGQLCRTRIRAESRAAARACRPCFARNTYDAATGTITVDPIRAAAFEELKRPLRRRFQPTAGTNMPFRPGR